MNSKYKLMIKGFALLGIVGLLSSCGGGGGGGGTPAAPADRYVLSGNGDGTISVFRNNVVAGYATAVGYFDAGSGFPISDMIYDEGNGRVVLITSGGASNGKIIVLSFDAATGKVEKLDERPTSGNSSHLALNSSGTAAYVASGASTLTTQSVDTYTISAAGILSVANSTVLSSFDPDYIKLNTAETRLYVVSRSNAEVLIFDINADSSLAGSPQTVATNSNPSAIGFNLDGTTAYLTRVNTSANLVVYSVGADGNLSQTTSLTNSNSPIDMVLSDDGQHLYVLDSSNSNVNHYTIDSSTGEPTFVTSTNLRLYPDFPTIELL